MRWKNILYNIAFSITCLLGFLLVFEHVLKLPLWLQVFGRAHPLFLHIPIGLLLLYAVMELFFPSKSEPLADVKDYLLLSGAVTVSLTALMGLFLSREEGYDPDLIAWHKWLGAAICVFLLVWYQYRHQIRRHIALNRLTAFFCVAIVTITGHFGGNITHGEGFLLAPYLAKEEQVKVSFEEALVFEHMVKPILKTKCITCHNERKAKGELVMESPESLMKGGKNGKLWDSTKADFGLFLERVHLPLENDDHMPPKGKPQLTDQEMAIIEAWIRSGSNFTAKVSELKEGDTLKKIAAALFLTPEEEKETYTFAKASDETIRSLNNFYRLVQPLDKESPALSVGFFGISKFTSNSIQELKPVGEQVVELDLNKMPVDDKMLASLVMFPNLRRLNLNFTNISNEGLKPLQKLAYLKELSLSGTKVDKSVLPILAGFPALKDVFLWSTAVDEGQVAALGRKSSIHFVTGYEGDTILLKLTPPLVQNEDFVIHEPTPLRMKHNINGAKIYYTLDGTEPDSVHSALYNNDLVIDHDVIVKTKVYRKGWLSSDTRSIRFFLSKIKPTEAELLTDPNKYYKGEGVRTLFDGVLAGDLQVVVPTQGPWLGFRETECDVLFALPDTSKPRLVTVSFVTNLERNVFSPESITMWVGNDKEKLTKVEMVKPEMPEKGMPSSQQLAYELKIPPNMSPKFVRIQAVPLPKAPAWQSDKRPGMIFVDEIVIK